MPQRLKACATSQFFFRYHSFDRIVCRALAEADRPAISAHYHALGHASRYQRFGRVMTDKAVAAYGARLNFTDAHLIGHFNGTQLVALAEISVNNRDTAPCEVALTFITDELSQSIGLALLKAAIASVRDMKQPRLLVTYQFGDQRVRELISTLRDAPNFLDDNSKLYFQVAVSRAHAPLPILLAEGGDISFMIEWRLPLSPLLPYCDA
jgi:hypothetical protein